MAFYSGSKTDQNLVFTNKGGIRNSSMYYGSEPSALTYESPSFTIINPGTGFATFGTSASVIGGTGGIGAMDVEEETIVIGKHDIGRVYVYDRTGTLKQTISRPGGDLANSGFGNHVNVHNGYIIVGTKHEQQESGESRIWVYHNRTTTAEYHFNIDKNLTDFPSNITVGYGLIVAGGPRHNSYQGGAYISTLTGDAIKSPLTNAQNSGYANQRFGMAVSLGCGYLAVSKTPTSDSGDFGSVHIFRLDGLEHNDNQVFQINHSDYYQSGDKYEFGRDVKIGSGRIAVGNTASNEVLLFDLSGNLIKRITLPLNNIPAYQNFSGARDYSFFGKQICITAGHIFISATGSNSVSPASISIFDLDGNYVNQIYDPKMLTQINDDDLNDCQITARDGILLISTPNTGLNDSGTFGKVLGYKINETYDDYIERISKKTTHQYTGISDFSNL